VGCGGTEELERSRRCRLPVLETPRLAHSASFLGLQPGSVSISKEAESYPVAVARSSPHARHYPGLGSVPVCLPGVCHIASLVKRWLVFTHHGAVEGDHLQACRDEFCFSFNRRSSRERGLGLYLASKRPRAPTLWSTTTSSSIRGGPNEPHRSRRRPRVLPPPDLWQDLASNASREPRSLSEIANSYIL